jgi:RNA polymerase sigma-70 factor (ECF subfamily)
LARGRAEVPQISLKNLWELFAVVPAMIEQVDQDDAPARTDQALVERARHGEREAFALLYSRHQASVYQFARALTGSGSLAEDVVQDSFLVLMRDLGRYDDTRGSLRTYLFGIARNLARAKTRSVRRLLSLEEKDDWAAFDDPTAALAASEDMNHLRQCLNAMPIAYREVLVLCHLHEMDYAEAAVVLSIPIGTVRSRLHRGRQMLLDRFRRRDHQPSSVSAPRRYAI